MGGIGTDNRAVGVTDRLQCHHIGPGSVEHRKPIGPGTKEFIDEFMETIGDGVPTVWWRIIICCNNGVHDFRVGAGNIIGGEMWISAGQLETS